MPPDRGDSVAAPWLVVIFASRLTLAWTGYDIGAWFTVDSDLFEQVVDSEITGFYDRLYAPDGSFVGVQIWLTPAIDLPELGYVRSEGPGCQFQLFFRAAPTDPRVDYDQSFGGRIYRSFGGTFAVSFDTFFLTDDERRIIAAADAAWIELE